MSAILFCLVLLIAWLAIAPPSAIAHNTPMHRRTVPATMAHPFGRPKPAWARTWVIGCASGNSRLGCRAIAQLFNRAHAHQGVSIGKTFVCNVLREHAYEIAILRADMRRRKPRHVPCKITWAMDMTGLADKFRHSHCTFGIIDQGSRLALHIGLLQDRSSIALLRIFLDTIERFGKPRSLKTDNEAVFTSKLFRFALRLLGIRHVRNAPHSPWQNGRIERFFGTLKSMARQVEFADRSAIADALKSFQYWYNETRPHQNLGGLTPREAWRGHSDPPGERSWFTAWDGVLCGIEPDNQGG